MQQAYKSLSSNSYCRWYTGDERGLDTDSLLFAYELLNNAGYLRTLFYDMDDVPGPAQFINFFAKEKYLTFILYRTDGTPIGMTWLEVCSHTGSQRFGHFTTFNTCERAEWVEAGRAFCRFIYEATNIKQLIGLTPACYRHALKAAQELGYKPVARLEKAVWCLGKERDAILSINELSEV